MEFRFARGFTALLAVFLLTGAPAPSRAQRRETVKPRVEEQPVPVQPKVSPGKIEVVREPIRPRPKLPTKLLLGQFTLHVEEYSNQGSLDTASKQVTGASGTAWLSFSCRGGISLAPVSPDLSRTGLPEGFVRRKAAFEVVQRVTEPNTQISLEDARLIKPDAALGQRIELDLAVNRSESRGLALAKDALIEQLRPKAGKGDIKVRFDNVTITEVADSPDTGRVTSGSASYPTEPAYPKVIKLSVSGFVALIDSLTLDPKGAVANITLQLPACIGAADTCKTAAVPLGTASISPDCEFYVEKASGAFGPWLIGDTGLIATGTGFVADFSAARSPGGRPAAWKGLALSDGSASGQQTIPKQSNTGYLAGNYSFANATITASGFTAQLSLSAHHEFTTVDPAGCVIAIDAATIDIADCAVKSGQLGPGAVALPPTSVCKEAHPGAQVRAGFTVLTVQSDMDLAGEVSFGPGTRISWGELTHSGQEVTAWEVSAKAGCIYLPAGPKRTFSPDTGAGFVAFSLSSDPPTALADMEAKGISGIAIGGWNLSDMAIYSPDRPLGTANPIKMKKVGGWLRIGTVGVDADLHTYESSTREPLGNEARPGYVGRQAFDATLNPGQKERYALFQFVSSAAYDSKLDGSIDLGAACNTKGLQFARMKTTSTANLVGGDITLPTTGVTLDYWKLAFVPTGDPTQAGVVSVRTGQLVFTAAAIDEPHHFEEPFKLTWGEILADGNLNRLFFDYNSYGQRFDGLKFSPQNIALSQYVPGKTDGYLAVCGSVYINFFGSAYVNIKDARNDAQPGDPHKGRMVTVPRTGEAGCKPTDLHLHGEWDDVTGADLSVFDFPDAQMAYNEKLQKGFTGTGTAGVSFMHSDPLNATIEIRGSEIDICMTSTTTHDLDVGLFLRLGGISHVSGCARIVGPTLERMVIGGYLDSAAGTGMGLLAPKAGTIVETVCCVTPNYFSFYASGDMLLSVAGSAVDLSGTVFLKRDWSRGSAEGDVTARINCNSVIGGLEGNGQLTWYAGPCEAPGVTNATTQYLQGRVAVSVCGWTGGAGLEGGLFVGHNVPKAKAWVLRTTTGRFGVTQQQLPDYLTGLYGYGQLSLGVNWYVFGGGVDLYAGMGAFTVAPDTPPPSTGTAGTVHCPGLPYVIGCAGCHVYGEILGGLVSASAWANLILQGPTPYFEGTFGLEGCVLWVLCASIDVTAGLNSSGFYLF